MTALLRNLALGLLVLVLSLASLTARAVSEGQTEMQKSNSAFNQGELETAIVHARRAAILYAPGAPHVSEAYERLLAIAMGAEAAGKRELAESAWRAARGAALETRHAWTPHAEELQRANLNLARLETLRIGETAGVVPSEGRAKANYERALHDLTGSQTPESLWVLALIAGFASVVLGLVFIALRGFDVDGVRGLRDARLGLVLAVAGAACWTLAVIRA